MKVSPYLVFNGTCIEAIELYEKAFNTNADFCKYKDAPPNDDLTLQTGLQTGCEEFIMHATLPIGSERIYLCDTTPDSPAAFSNGVAVCVELDTVEEMKSVFEVLSEGAKIFYDLGETFWSKYYAEFEDKFGIKWSIMIEE